MGRAKPTLTMLVMASVGVVVGVVAREPISELFRKKPTPPSQLQIKLPPTPEEIAKPHLAWADHECERVIDEHLEVIDTFFADAKKNTPAFAEDSLSYGSKWRLIADHARVVPRYYLEWRLYRSVDTSMLHPLFDILEDKLADKLKEQLPSEPGDMHQKFIREKFEEHIFKPEQLQDAVKQAVQNYLKNVDSIEGQMLVSMKRDVADFPSAFLIAQLDETKLRESYNEAISRAMAAGGNDLIANIGTELVTNIACDVLAQVAIRMCVSAGILTAGAESSLATGGISLAVAIIVDQIVSRVWDWYADPKGNLAIEVDKKLDAINRMIVDGSEGVKGLRAQLQAFAKARAHLRREAVLNILQQ